MSKDPAVLFYIANWLTSTAAMDADARGWYLNLMLHNYDKQGLPNDVEILAQLASVKFSEYERFKQVLEQVLKQKFTLNEETGLLENPKTMETLRSREEFKDKRQRSGNIGVVIKLAKSIIGFGNEQIEMLKTDLFSFSDDKIEEAKSEQVLKQMLKLYININKDINKDTSIDMDLLKKVMDFFNFTESANANKMRDIRSFLICLKQQNKSEYFKKQFEDYCKVKIENPKFKHAFSNYLGTAKELYEDGAWDSEIWSEKLNPFINEKRGINY